MITDAGITRLTVPVSGRDHVRGPMSAAVTLVEYGDYECPYCGAAHLVVQEMLALLGDQVCFVFRHFPLTQVHPHAENAAEAAEAAGAQGRFWEMHDTLFEHQNALDDAHLVRCAAAHGLDLRRFERELEAHVYADRVREDFRGGVRSGVNGTPSFFINGVRHDGPWDAPHLLVALRAAGA